MLILEKEEEVEKREKFNGSSRWSPEEIRKDKEKVEKIREYFASKGITGEEASKMILQMRHGKEEWSIT